MESFFFKISVMLVPALLAITFHEVAHGFVAWHFGDPTAKMLGRLTLNPLKHLDIIGTLMIFLIGIGWAKPVPVVPQNLRNPEKDMIWVAAAGPLANILLACLSALLFRLLMFYLPSLQGSSLAEMILTPVLLMMLFSIYINLLLAIFNMLPIPPLDGGRILVGILPRSLSNSLASLERYGMIIVLIFFFTGAIKVIYPLHTWAFNLLVGTNQLMPFRPFIH